MRDSFVFYRSFFDAVKNLPAEDFKKCVAGIAEYALNEKQPETNGIERTVFELVKPQIDANNKRYENGSKGGRPRVVNQSEPNDNQEEPKANQNKPNDNQVVTKCEPNVNDNVNVNDNKKKDSKESKEKAPRFIPPTRQEVQAYCQEKGYKNVDVERFIDYHTSNGWMVGRNKMKDWKACVRNWNRGQRQGMTAETKKSKQRDFEQRNYDMDAMTKNLLNLGE